MIIDFVLAAFAGFGAESFTIFTILMFLALIFVRRDRPWSSGLVRFALMALGISALLLLFGGSDCDWDL